MNQFYAYHFMVRDSSRVLHLSGRLFQEYVVDAYAKVEESRLHWIRCNQRTLRASLYRGLMDQVATDGVVVPAGRMIILPPSFTGGPRYMQGLYQDAMAIELLHLIIDKEIFSKVKGRVYVVEFQKCGLPHAHMLWILDDPYKPRTPEHIDKIVCAELPDPSEKELFDCVAAHMIHGSCGSANPRCPCMKNEKCSKKFPKEFISSTQVNNDGYPLYFRHNNGRVIQKGSHLIDNRWVVPYNKYLCKVFNCHINVEICSSIQSVKYLYKYVYKGHDCIQAKLSSKVPPMDDAIAGAAQNTTSHDETQQYLDARYVSASEAFWRICKFSMQKMYPIMYALQVHDDNMQSVVYAEGEPVSDVMDRSACTPLTKWMRYNREHPEDEVAKRTLYSDFPSYYTWNDSTRRWSRCHRLQCIGRLHFVCPHDTTRYYLQLMLHHVPGARCYEDLRTVDDVVYDTYQSAAEALGLLHSDTEFDNDLALASAIASPHQICKLFAMILLYCELSQPDVLFEKYLDAMSDDIRLENCASQVTNQIRQKVLRALDSILYHNGTSLAAYPVLPQLVKLRLIDTGCSPSYGNNIQNAVIAAEHLRDMMNVEQRQLYDAVFEAIKSTHRAKEAKASRLTAIPTATSGIAALLLEGGRMLHSTFNILIPVTHISTCGISPDSVIGRQIQSASIIIVDEAPMVHCHVYEMLDRSIRDVMNTIDATLENIPFGGKVVVMGGDFRQMLPVIQKGSRSMIISSSLNRSDVWRHCSIFLLKTNVRVSPEQQAWSEFLLAVGEGRVDPDVHLPTEIQRVSSLLDLIARVYGTFEDSTTPLVTKTILTPLNIDVVKVNNMVLDVFLGEVMEYFSFDAVPLGEVNNESLYPTEFLNTIDDATMPLHKLRLKIGCIVILLQNLNTLQDNGYRNVRQQGHLECTLSTIIHACRNILEALHFLPSNDCSLIEMLLLAFFLFEQVELMCRKW
ncbi:uncharacterized protein LOC144707103 [Wolffia australiana]